MKKLIIYLFLLGLPLLAFSQAESKLDIGDQFIKTVAAEKYELSSADLNGMIVTDNYVTKHNGLRHIYYQQTYKGIPIEHANMNLNITVENEVPFYRSSFHSDVHTLISNSKTKVSAIDAIASAARSLDLPMTKSAILVRKNSDISYQFKNPQVSRKEIPANLKYVELDGKLQLVWDVEIAVPGSADYWSTKVDALSGTVVSKDNRTLYCNVKHTAYRTARPQHKCDHKSHKHSTGLLSNTSMVSGSYLAYALPTESPSHGDQEVVVQPHDPLASPFGWHDTDGNDGPEYTTTLGNNVHAFLDLDGNAVSDGNDPDGGDDLIFDFVHDKTMNAEENFDAAIVNLFVSINQMHDILYKFGFDEAAGNYQFNNYGNPGNENDHMLAAEASPNAVNNASFLPTPDGLSGEMNMGIWDRGTGVLSVNEPEQLQGSIDAIPPSGAADGTWGILWGLDVVDISGNVVLASDGGLQNPTTCCNTIVNTDDVMGNIAMIDRGLCEFGRKGLRAQEAGAIGAIICNVEGVNGGTGEELVNMNGGLDGLDVTIPVVFAVKSFCDRVKLSIANGTPVNLNISNQDQMTETQNFNSSFDNGVIAHELGHGVNGRLVGGPGNPNGLSNAEQMGEGWSDFFSVAFTIEEGDTGEDLRGIATYVFEQPADGVGLRLYHYSRDFNVSPYTYGDIVGLNEVHAIGEIWTAMIWDVMWNFIDAYGFDPAWDDPNSGNYKAMQIIMDGFKIVGARPGFEDARDAIIAADDINNGGENLCLLWDTFARRGLGVDADQGSPDDSNDGIEGFQSLPSCLDELRISKTASDLIEPGDPVDVTINVANYTQSEAENVLIVDQIPDRLTYIDGSGTIAPTIDGSELKFDLGTMASLEEANFSYQLASDPADFSTQLLYDNIENLGNEWTVDFLSAEGFNLWSTTQLAYNSEFNSWYVEAVNEDSQQTLIYNNLQVSGDKPTLRFWHQINTINSVDGGFLEVSNDGGLTWFRVDDKFIRNGYPRSLTYTTFAIPALNAYSGDSGGFVDSYLDLSEYSGQTISIRFRFGTDGSDIAVVPANLPGWFVDDLELMDLLKHESTACMSADDKITVCTDVIETIVNTKEVSSAFEANVEGFEFNVFPNPASEEVNISLKSEIQGDYVLRLSTIEGRQVGMRKIPLNSSSEYVRVNIKSLDPGFYIVQLDTEQGTITRKMIVE